MKLPLCPKRRITAFAVILCAGIFATAQSPVPSADLDLFGNYLDRADRSVLRDDWEAFAGEGEAAAMAEWERDALLFLESGGDPESIQDELDELREEAKQELSEMKNRRLVTWLMDRFVRENTALVANEYLDHLKTTRNSNMFVMKDGKIERDSTGNPVQTAVGSEEDFAEELSGWRDTAAQYFEGMLSRSKSSAATVFTDLLSSLDGETRELLASEREGLFSEMERSQRRQGDLLLRLEQSDYRYFRLRDQYSMRLDSENASAGAQAEALIEKTRSELQAGLDRVEQGLTGEIGEVVRDGYLVDGDGWRDAFREEFEKGLALWNEAEEDFFVRRVEWERQAGQDLADGMDAWKRAFEALKEEQSLWLDEMESLRKKGEEAFDREFEELAEAREKALAELDASIMENRSDLVERVESTVENLNRSLEMMNTARNSIDYWLSAVTSGEAYDMDLVSWSTDDMLESMLQKMVSDAFGSLGALNSDRDKTLTDFHQKLEDLLKNRLYTRIAKHYQDKVSSGELDQYLNEQISRNSTRSLEEWQEILTARLNEGIDNDFEAWFKAALGEITVGDLLGRRPEISNPFNPDEKEAERVNEFNEKMKSLFSLPSINKAKDKDWYMIEYGYPDGEREYEKALQEQYASQERYREAQDAYLNYSITAVRNGAFDFDEIYSRFAENENKELKNTIAASVGRENYAQAWYWFNTIYVHYAGEAEKQNEDLEKTYGLVVFDKEEVPPEGYAENETIRGPIAALDEYGWESVCLDDYQLEHVKARAVEAYWEKEVAVAEAVYAYAVDETSSRDTEAETLDKSENALAGYNAALAAYHEAVAALEAVNEALGEKRGEIEAVRAVIAEKQAALAEAKREYADMLVMAELDTADFYIGQFRAQYEQLLSERGLLDEPVWSYDELESSAETYLGSLAVENASAALDEAVNGNVLEDPPLLSLSELGRIASLREEYVVPEDIEVAAGGNIGKYLSDELGLGSCDYWYAVLKTAYESSTEDTMDELARLFSTARSQLLAESKAAIDDRLLVIELLLSKDAGAVNETIASLTECSPLVARYMQYIPVLVEQGREEALDSFGIWLADTGLGSVDENGIAFTSPEMLWNTSVIPQLSPQETADWLCGLELDGREIFAAHYAPDAVASLFEQWFDSLAGFVLAKTAHARNGVPLSDDELDEKFREVEAARVELESNPSAGEHYIRVSGVCRMLLRYNSIASEAESSFRQYLAETHARDLLYDFKDGETWADVEAYGQSTCTGTVCAETGRAHAYSMDGTVNVGLEYASFLDQYADAFRSLLASWTGTDEDALNTFAASNASLASLTRESLMSDPENGTIEVVRISADASAYSDALNAFLSHVKQQKNLTYEMGKTAATVVAFIKASEAETAEMTAGILVTIEGLEGEIQALQNDWCDLIGVRGDEGAVPEQGGYGEATYAELERAYTARYEEARARYEALEDAKQEYKEARAIHEYAATPYLGIDAKKTAEEEYVLVEALDAVDPDTCLAEAREKHLRSVAAREAIEAIYENDGPESLYERDEKYRNLRDAYEKQYRYLLASKQMQVLLDEEIQKAHGKLAEAKNNYEDILASIQNLPGREEDGSFAVETVTTVIEENITNLGKYPKDMLAGLTIVDGTIQWGPPSESGIPDSVYSNITAYLTSEEGLKSEFVEDLIEWLMNTNQSKLNDMANALSWEIFRDAGGMTYDQYKLLHPPRDLPYEGYGVPEGTTKRETEREVEARWKRFVRENIWDNLLSDYTGGKKSGDLWEGFTAAYSYGRKYRISETGLIDDLYTCHQSIASSDDYAFFKFAALTGLLGTEVDSSPVVSTQLVNSLFSQTLFYQLADYCQKEGCDSGLSKPAWHNKRDESYEASGSAGLDYRIVTGIVTAAANLQKAQETIDEKQAALDLLTGASVEGGPGIDDLIVSLVSANNNGSGQTIRDILKTAGITYNKNTFEEDLRRIITSDGKHETLREEDSSTLLSSVVRNLTGDFGDSERELSEYLYSNSAASPGIAKTHAERRQEYAEAVNRYIEAGMLPERETSEEDVEEWEALLRRYPADGVLQDVLTETESYLAHTDGIDSDQKAIRVLAEAWDRYDAYRARKEAEGLDADTVHGRNLASDVYGAFASLVQSYRIGIDYLAAFEKTLEDGAFDARENALRECELFKTVLDDLQSETSGIGTYVLGSVTNAVKQSYVKLNDVRMSAIREARVNEWDIALRELNGRYEDFNRQMNAIYSRGMLEWRNANRKITAAMETWQKEYQDSFEEKAEEWTNRYITFLQKKEAWVDTIAEQAVQIGNNEILRNMGAMTRDAIADATSFIIPDVIELPDTDCFLASIVDRNLLSGLLSSAAERNRGIEAFTPAIFQTLKRNAYNSAETLEKIRIFQTEENEEIAARLAFIRYDQALTTLKDAKKSLEENIDGANRSTWANFRDMFIREGFTESGGNFVKNTTVGATLMDSLTEKHVIEGYRYFKTTVKDFTQGIMTPEEIDLEAIGATGIQALLDQAMGAVDEESKRIFGSSEDTTYEKDSLYKDTYQVKKYRLGSEAGERIEYMVDKVRYLPQTETVTQDDYEKYMKSLANLSDEQRSDLGQQIQYREVKSGEFNKWIGYAPVFLDDADPGHDLDEYWKNVRFAGSGETGRIMGLFTQHKMIEGAGRAEANTPAYSRRLWDDRGSFMPAPTIRTLVDIAVTIAVSCFTGPGGGLLMNALISTAFNMIDDAVFALLDMANGMDPMDVAEGFTKKAATTFASSAISGASSAFAASNSALTSGVIGSTMLKGTEIMATNVATSAINAIDLRGLVTGGDAFDEDAFGKGAFGRDAMAGVAAGMAGNAVTVGMNNWNLGKDAMKVDMFNSGQISQMKGLNSFMGGLASSGVTYAMTDNATFNIARIKGTGVLEMHVGKDGFGMNVGMGGTDISLGTIANAVQGAQHWRTNTRIEKRAKDLDLDVASVLRSQYGFGDGFAQAQLESILDGSTDLVKRDGQDGEAQTVRENDKRVVYLDNYKEGMTREEMLRMGVTLQHEAYRDGIVNEDNVAETVFAVYGHTAMTERVENDARYSDMMKDIVANDATLSRDREQLAAGSDLNKYAEYVLGTYDSSGDYWRVLKNGDLYDDGLDDQISFEDGRETIKTGKGKQGTLEEYLGMEAGTGYSEILSKLDYGYENGSWTIKEGKTISASMIQGLVDQGIVKNSDYNNPVAKYYTGVVKGYKDDAREQSLLTSMERVQKNLDIQSGNGDITTPYYTNGDPFIDQVKLASLLGTSDVGPCFISAAMDPFIQMGFSAQQVTKAISQMKYPYLDAKDGGVIGSLPIMWKKMAEELGASKYPSYYYENDPLKTVNANQLKALDVSMALVALYDPNRNTTDPNHWMYQYKYDSSWFVSDPWPKNDGIFGTWTGSTWHNTTPVYRPLKYEDR